MQHPRARTRLFCRVRGALHTYTRESRCAIVYAVYCVVVSRRRFSFPRDAWRERVLILKEKNLAMEASDRDSRYLVIIEYVSYKKLEYVRSIGNTEEIKKNILFVYQTLVLG